jgi:dihydrofolate synthase / folylpolyglutamate synthase
MEPTNAKSYTRALHRLLEVTSSPRFGLERMEELMLHLGNPEREMAILHVAGTNGKGSICAFLDSILGEAGISRGMATSPHLTSACERVRVNGEPISAPLFCEAEDAVYCAASKMQEPPTFFERMVAMAFWVFAKKKLEIAICEVGLGGRLDATNIVQRPLAVGLSPIGFDHQEFLGQTLAEIASEKAGIIKPGTIGVSAKQMPDAAQAIRDRAIDTQSDIMESGRDFGYTESTNGIKIFSGNRILVEDVVPGIKGKYQLENAAVATIMLDKANLELRQEHIANGLANARWPGRFETVAHDPSIILDGAHNADAILTLASEVAAQRRLSAQPVFLIWGATRGHDLDRTIAAWTVPVEQCWAVQSRAPRSVSADAVKEALLGAGHSQVIESKVETAVADATAAARVSGGLVVVTGSLYLVGEVRAMFTPMPIDPTLPDF